MKISHYYPHSGGILGCHANVDFQHTNYLLNVTICEKLRCAHKLQTISDAFSHIASRFVKVALAIKFALNWLAGPQCTGLLNRATGPSQTHIHTYRSPPVPVAEFGAGWHTSVRIIGTCTAAGGRGFSQTHSRRSVTSSFRELVRSSGR